MSTSVPAPALTPPTLDWWYVRAYPGSSHAVDAAAAVLVPWLREQAAREGAGRWFFMRYLDMTGQHLRLRLQASPESVDRLQGRIGDVEELLRALPETGFATRLIEGADLAELPGARAVRPAMFAPEMQKYGGTAGVELALDLATAGSTWFDEHQVASLRPRYERAALAVAFQRLVVSTAFDSDEERVAFWAAHQRHWGWQLRMLVPTAELFRSRADETVEGIRGAPLGREQLHALEELAGEIVATLAAASDAGVLPTRAELLLEYLHMEMNRWGFMPAEECLIGMLGRTHQAGLAGHDRPAHTDRKEAS